MVLDQIMQQYVPPPRRFVLPTRPTLGLEEERLLQERLNDITLGAEQERLLQEEWSAVSSKPKASPARMVTMSFPMHKLHGYNV